MLHEENESMKHRIDGIMHDLIGSLEIDLNGYTVFTEAATGPYLYTPILAALADAERVYAVTSDSRYGTKKDVRRRTREAGIEWGVDDEIEVIFEKTPKTVSKADIITNTGFVRPIDRKMVSWMKPTAVVPLMWEPWEFRGEVDLEACREHGICVMGTDESKEPVNMYPYGGFLAMKLLFELGLEGYKTSAILLGSGEGLGESINRTFREVGIKTKWFSDIETDTRPYEELPSFFESHGSDYDVIITAEHHDDVELLGPDGVLGVRDIESVAPAMAIGVISGNVDREALQSSSIRIHPRELRPKGYMSYQPANLGPRPPLELYASGIKVGQLMAECRKKLGLSIKETMAESQKRAPAVPVNVSEADRRD